jgi:hypothetical protein
MVVNMRHSVGGDKVTRAELTPFRCKSWALTWIRMSMYLNFAGASITENGKASKL